MKISIIIPVYNTMEYLEKCLDSIINQTIGFSNTELILINDGSSDDSEKIIKSYLSKYDNIRYISQKNQGQANSRNNGLKIATGEYITFIDSDDYIDKDMLKALYNEAKKGNYDIVASCCTKEVKKEDISITNLKITDDSNCNFIMTNVGPTNFIVRRDYLKKENFEFPLGIIYEDLASIPALGINAKIKYVETPYYNYLIRLGSTMNAKKYSKKLEDIFKSFNVLETSFKIKDKDNRYAEELEYLYIRRMLMSASLRFIEFNDPNNCINKISNIIHEKYPNWRNNKYYKKLSFKQKIVAVLTYNKNKCLLKLLFKLNRSNK